MELTSLNGEKFYVNPNLVCFYGLACDGKGRKRREYVAISFLNGREVGVQDSLESVHRKMSVAIVLSNKEAMQL